VLIENPEPGVTRRTVGRAEARRASRGWWDADADAYQAEHGGFLGDVQLRWCPEGLLESQAGLLGPVAGATVLELGCGAAAGARWLAAEGARVVGLDLSAGMLRHALDGAKASGVPVPLVQADALALPFADQAFDIVGTAFGAVPFVDDSAAAMREVYRVLRPGGRLLVLGPNIRYASRVYWDFFDHHLPLSDRSMAEGLELAGFRVEHVRPRFLPYTIKSRLPRWPILVRLYLRLPPLHRVFGKQMFLVAVRP